MREAVYSVNQMRISISKTIKQEIQMGADEQMAELLEKIFSEFLLDIQKKEPKAILN